MSDRKYRQRGYQDSGQGDQASSSRSQKPRERREGPRTPNMPGFRTVNRCSRCGQIFSGSVAHDSACGKCGTDLYACVQCTWFDGSSRFECSQSIEVRISPKDRRNTCNFFQARTTVERKTGSEGPPSAKKAFDDLFN